MAKKVVIFDFDGTIAETLDSIVNVMNGLSDELGYRKVTGEDIDELRNKNPKEILKDLGISILKLSFVGKRIKSELNKKIEYVPPVSGIEEALLELKKTGYKLGILTSNSKDNVSKFLKKNNLDLFDFIHSESSIFGKSRVINDFLKNQCIKLGEVIYVGDETRDIAAAKKTNIPIIAVSWGFNSKQILENQNPDFLIDEPRQLIEIMGSLQKPIA